METGKLIKELRIKKGLTQEELADKTKVSARTIQRIENGEVDPRSYTLQMIAKALDVDFSLFIEDESREDKVKKTKDDRFILGILHLSGLLPIFIPTILIWINKKNKVNGIKNHFKDIMVLQLTIWLISIIPGIGIYYFLSINNFINKAHYMIVVGLSICAFFSIMNSINVLNNRPYKRFILFKSKVIEKMKSIKHIVIILAIMSFTGLYGQRNPFETGLLFNINGIHLESETWGGNAISIGSFVTYDLSKKVSGIVEIRYTQKGGNLEYNDPTGIEGPARLKLNYIEVPILIGFNSNSNIRNFSIQTGFSYGRLINANNIFNDFIEEPSNPNAKKFCNRDLSWIANLKFHAGLNRKIICGFRFSHSILSIHDYFKLYNMTFGFEINYLIFR